MTIGLLTPYYIWILYRESSLKNLHPIQNFRVLEPLVDFKFNFKIYNGVLKAFKKLFLNIEFVCFYVYKKIKSITLFPYTALNIFMWHDGKGTLQKFLLSQRKFSYNSHENEWRSRSVFLLFIFFHSNRNEIYLDLLNTPIEKNAKKTL